MVNGGEALQIRERRDLCRNMDEPGSSLLATGVQASRLGPGLPSVEEEEAR
jgi:hypothetical protein